MKCNIYPITKVNSNLIFESNFFGYLENNIEPMIKYLLKVTDIFACHIQIFFIIDMN